MAREDRIRWEAKYAEAPAASGAVSPFVVRHAELLRGRVLDVAAGAGRNALWLARGGATVCAVDVAITGLRRLAAAARDEGLAVDCVQADLEEFPLPVDHFDAAINIRYLQRSLLAPLRRAVRPGGVVLVETFLSDPRAVGQPRNPDHLLHYGELAAAFAGFEILERTEGRVDDGGAPAYLGRIVARRPAAGVESR